MDQFWGFFGDGDKFNFGDFWGFFPESPQKHFGDILGTGDDINIGDRGGDDFNFGDFCGLIPNISKCSSR